MKLFNLTELDAMLAPGIRLIGVDPGRRIIGIALSDVGRRLASPAGKLRRGRLVDNAAEIAGLAAEEGAGGLVIGWPLEIDGRMGPAAQAARDWARDLSAQTRLPAAMWDESLTSADAHDVLRDEAGLGRRRRAALVDAMAAAAMLQDALDTARGFG